jgi:hypothetical protein
MVVGEDGAERVVFVLHRVRMRVACKAVVGDDEDEEDEDEGEREIKSGHDAQSRPPSRADAFCSRSLVWNQTMQMLYGVWMQCYYSVC